MEVGASSASGGGISQAATECLGASLAVGPDGKPVVSWSQQSSGNLEIFVRGWNGSIWDEVGAGSATAGGISGSAGASSEPSLAVSAEGTFLAAWTDDTSGNDEIYAQLFEATYIPAVIPDTTKPLSGEALQSLESVSSDGVTFTFREPPGRWRTSSPSAVNPTDLEPGDIMAGAPSAATPDGFLRKVTGVTSQGDQWVVDTTTTTVEEAIEDGSLDATVALNPDDIQGGTTLEGVTLLSRTHRTTGLKLIYSIEDVDLYDDGFGHTITANGSIETELSFDVQLRVRHFKLERLLFTHTVTESADLDISCGTELTLIEKEVEVARHYFSPLVLRVGYVPVVICPVLTVYVGIDGSVKVGIETGVTQEMSLTAGLAYSDGQWRPIAEFSKTFEFRPPASVAELEARAYGGAQLSGLVYGVAGPYASIEAYLKLQAGLVPAPWWKLYGGLDVPVGVKLEILSHLVAEYEKHVIEQEWLLAGNTAPNAPSAPSPADGATGQSVTVNLGWAGDDPDGDAVTFDVYFEAGDTTPDVKVANHQAAKTYDLPVLAAGTHYYWKIVAFDEHGLSTAGPVWDFTTAAGTNNPPNPPSAPSPVDGATGQSVTVNLGWAGDDPDGDAVTFDVYFEAGDATPDVKVADHQAAKTYDLPVLAAGTHYYWQIVAFDEHGLSTAGPVWDFTTASGGTGLVQMVDVPGGTFTMGRRDDGDDANGKSWELPRHEVTLSAYRIGKYEVTNAQFCDVLNWALSRGYLMDYWGRPYTGGDVYTSGQKILEVTSSDCQISYTAGSFVSVTRDANPMDDHPVVMVTWYGAVAFVNWLSEKEGLTPAYNLSTWQLEDADSGTPGTQFTNGYRLPTEAEWERAAAWDGSKHWIYGFKSDALTDSTRANYWVPVNPLGLLGYPYTSPVGWFDGVNVSPNGPVQTLDSPSPVGAYDMSGNVWEWCHDWYNSSYYSGGAMTDPLGPSPSSNRVIRGGSWNNNARNCRSANRNNNSPGNSNNNIGFRLAAARRDAPESDPPNRAAPRSRPFRKGQTLEARRGW